jgi:dTDP-4-dehydrorhamnose reductase
MVTGALGQIGSELIVALRGKYGMGNVIATDCRPQPLDKQKASDPFRTVDVMDIEALDQVITNTT